MTWTAPTIDRADEPTVGDELTMLAGWLDYHRQTLLLKCQGLTAEQLKTASAGPSNLTLLGLVRHMADVERGWFRRWVNHEDAPPIYAPDEHPDDDFELVAEADAEADFAVFTAEVEAARAAALGHGLDEIIVRPDRRDRSVRWVYIHMIEEYARHNGHADLIRERIDGATGD
jgi:hypothetical protein